MRTRILAAIMASASVAQAQQHSSTRRIDWHRVDLAHLNRTLQPANLGAATEAVIHELILQTIKDDCDDAGVFTYSVAPLGRAGVVYASPGQGCLRGGQGSNASLFLVDTTHHPFTIIATPDGWGLGIQPSSSHGLHDFVTGWHMSAFEYSLIYYRFDGKQYQPISTEDLRTCAETPDSTPDPGMCLSDGKRIRQTGS